MGHDGRATLIVTPLIGAHIRAIVPQAAQRGKLHRQTEAYATNGTSWTVWTGTEIIFCGGIMPIWPGRAYAWSILTERAGLHFVGLHRIVRTYLNESSVKRIEVHVDADFLPGHRWVRLLGFNYEGIMRSFNPDGTDAVLYARIR